MSAEGSSLAKEVGSLLPAVALGLPSGIGMVLFIAAMTIAGLQPGEALLRSHPSLPYSMMWVMAITGLLSCAVGLALSPWLSRVSRLRGPVLFPFIAGLAVLGSYAAIVNAVGMVELLVFAVIGLLARKGGYSLAAMVIGLVLGGTFDDQVHVTAETYGWSFIGRDPIADLAILAALALIAARVFGTIRRRRGTSATSTSDAALPAEGPVSLRERHSKRAGWLGVVTAAIVVVCSGWYFAVSLGYPTAAGLIPAVVSIIVFAAGIFELAAEVTSLRRSAAKSASSAVPAVPSAAGVAAGGPVPAMVGGSSEAPGEFSGRRDPGSRALALDAADPGEAGAVAGRRWGERVGWREAASLVWVVTFVVGVFILGFEVGLPLVGGVFSLTATRWPSRLRQAAFSASVVAFLVLLAIGFVDIFHFQYSGLLV